MAPRDILPGTDYAEAIINGIGECQLLIVVFSSGANESPEVRREVERAVSKGKIILPFRIEEITPSKAMEYCLGNTHWLDALTPPLESHLSRLAETVALLLNNQAAVPGSNSSPAPLPKSESNESGYEYRSEHELFGFPLVHIVTGLPLVNGIRPGARGLIAIGDSPRGIIAIGGFAVGGIALGAFSIGVVPIGFLALGIFPAGAVAIGLVASWGLVSMAPIAMGCLAVGYYAAGVYATGKQILTTAVAEPGAAQFFQSWMKPWFHATMATLPRGYQEDTNRFWPMVFYLHGLGEGGYDVEKVLRFGPPKLIAAGKDLPCIVVSPQVPDGYFTFRESNTMLEILEEVTARYRVDQQRVHVTGNSMGAYGAVLLAAREPERFASLTPMCGGVDYVDALRLRNVPIWAFHGEKDPIIPVEESRRLVELVKKIGGNARLTVYPGVGHNCWDRAYDDPALWDWILAQKK